MYFAFYNATPIRGFTSILTVVCEKTIIMWVLPTASKREPLRAINFILKTLMNEQHPCKIIRVDEYSALVNSIDVKNLLIDELKISMETTVGDASWINGNNERHNRSIHNMLRAGLLDINYHENKWCFSVKTSAEVHRFIIHSDLDNTSPNFSWYGKNPIIHELRVLGCDIDPITSSPTLIPPRDRRYKCWSTYTSERSEERRGGKECRSRWSPDH